MGEEYEGEHIDGTLIQLFNEEEILTVDVEYIKVIKVNNLTVDIEINDRYLVNMNNENYNHLVYYLE